MIKWFGERWRFLAMVGALGAIYLLSHQFLAGPVAGEVTTFVISVGGNMIFDLINRPAWERRVQERDEQIAERDRTIANQKRNIEERDQKIAFAERDRAIADKNRIIKYQNRIIEYQDREIAELRRQIEEGKNGNSAG